MSSDPSERGREWGWQWLTDKGRVDKGKAGAGRTGLKRELSGAGDPFTQHRTGRVQNQILQVPEEWLLWLEHRLAQHTASCICTWDSPHAGHHSTRKAIHAYGFWLCLCIYYQIVTVVLWILVCRCLLTLAKKHPSVWEQWGAFKFNDNNEHTKQVITTRKAWLFSHLQKGLEQ